MFLADQGYDPFNPEVVRPQEQQNGQPAPSGDLSGALEMVNRAIEEVRGEVEREQRKLSRIGDEPYSPTEKTGSSSSYVAKNQAAASHLAYDPGSYQITSGGYDPTPGCSKYTLDSDSQKYNSSSSMEYVPTSLKKPQSRTQVPCPPQSTKYLSTACSAQWKYTLDNSGPSTNMEYDPLSNYSAGIAVKNKRDEGSHPVETDYKKAYRLDASDKEGGTAGKKPPQASIDLKKYTISDSDEESSGTEYRPTSLSNLQQRKANIVSARDALGKDTKDRSKSIKGALTQRNKEELAQDLDSQENTKQKENLEKRKLADQSGHGKISKPEKTQNIDKEVKKSSSVKSSSGSSSSAKDKLSCKNFKQDSAKKENKNQKDDSKNMLKMKDKVQREGRDEKRCESKSKMVEKVKRALSEQEKDARESKKLKPSEREKDQSKNIDSQHRNGKLDSSRREKDVKKSKSSSSSCKGSSAKAKQSASSSKEKLEDLSLSHADLFGDESPEEADPMEADSDDEPEEVLVRKSADALKRGLMSKRTASERTPSSSEDKADGEPERSRSSWEEPDDVRVDFSMFQDDLDFDSDPMEECLRIFNESNDVKKEDKGRQAKQVLLSFVYFSFTFHSYHNFHGCTKLSTSRCIDFFTFGKSVIGRHLHVKPAH